METILVKTNEEGRVVAQWRQLAKLGSAKKQNLIEQGCVEVTDNNNRPETGRWQRAVKYLEGDSIVWKTHNVTPDEVAKYKLIIALRREGVLDDVNNKIDDMDEEVKIAWENSHIITRDAPVLAAIADKMDFDSDYVDELFRSAADIEL